MAVDVPLAHLDRLFDYAVPPELDAAAAPGVRVRVRFAGRLVDGFVVDRPAADSARGAASSPAGTGGLQAGTSGLQAGTSGLQAGGGGPRDGHDEPAPARLRPLERVVSGEPVVDEDLLRLCRAVADRYAGTLADVLRLAIPPRHARAEREAPTGPPAGLPPVRPPDPGPWADYPAGPSYLHSLTAGASPRVVWSALPGQGWLASLSAAVAATVAGGRGALVLAPDRADLTRLDAALTTALGRGRHVVLTADVGPPARYRRWLMARRGVVPVVIGTRAAVFAPLARPGLLAIWDDGDDSYDEPRAPYPHAREVLALRAGLTGAGLLIGGHATTVEAAALVESGWARGLSAPRAAVRTRAPLVLAGDDEGAGGGDPLARAARLPTQAWRVARDALSGRSAPGARPGRTGDEAAAPPRATADADLGVDLGRGPVLVQVPRRGYLPLLSCQGCRAPLRCPACQGSVGLGGRDDSPRCRWCGRGVDGWTCPACGATRWRARAVGARRTAEELGRAFPGVPVLTSAGGSVLRTVPDRPALVVATPGAEPVPAGGYAAALLLDGWALLARPSLRAGEEALRRWMAAAALVRPAAQGGRVVVVAEPAAGPVQALIRWDPVGYATRELAGRREARLPPAVHLVEITGAPGDVESFLAAAGRPEGVEVLGPLPVAGGATAPAGAGPHGGGASPPGEATQPQTRAVLRVDVAARQALLGWLRATLAARAARKVGGPVRVRVDPPDVS